MATANTTIATSETDLMIVIDGKFTRQSQLTAFYDITLGGATNIAIRYYMSPDKGVTWFQVPLKDKTTNILGDTPSNITSASPTQSGHIKVIEDVPLSGNWGYKITGQATNSGTAATLVTGYIYIRDN